MLWLWVGEAILKGHRLWAAWLGDRDGSYEGDGDGDPPLGAND
jgi:hypothetical protein